MRALWILPIPLLALRLIWQSIRGWRKRADLVEIFLVAGVMGFLGGMAEDGLVGAFLIGLGVSAGIGLLYWLAIPPSGRRAERFREPATPQVEEEVRQRLKAATGVLFLLVAEGIAIGMLWVAELLGTAGRFFSIAIYSTTLVVFLVLAVGLWRKTHWRVEGESRND